MFDPKDVADSIIWSETCLMPALVNLIIGGIAYIIVAKIAGAPPIPKKNNAGNKYTKQAWLALYPELVS